MVMATGSVCSQYATCEQSHEGGDVRCEAALALHERLVAFVQALGGAPRGHVAAEHSYARARSAAAAAVRVLPAAPPAPPAAAPLDVQRPDPPPPDPPADLAPHSDTDDDDLAPDWEERVRGAATGEAQARLAERALDALRRLRLARLAARTRHERAHAERVAARRLRLAAAGVAGGGAWLRGALEAALGAGARRLAWRREGERVAPAVGAGRDEGPLLVWVGCGRARLDARWTARLGAVLRVRALGCSAAPAAPEPWCAAAAGSLRAALLDALADAGERAVIVGGIGSGASLVTSLVGGVAGVGRVVGALLLAPALLTAEGADEAVRALGVPALLVLGARSAAAPRGVARALCRPHARPQRRLLEVRGADHLLRLPARAARRLPQPALEAAIAEECARWATEVSEGEGADTDHDPPEPEEYAHLPLPGLERVVSRGSGGTPLALPPPRRREPAPPAPPAPPPSAPLAAADIMRLPIVFADDVPEPSPLTVTAGTARGRGARGRGAGADRISRVIVASRAPRPPRPVLLRRNPRPHLH